METNDEEIRKDGKDGKDTRPGKWLLVKLGFWFYLALLVCLLVGAVVIAFTNHTGGWLVGLGALVGAVIIWGTHLLTGGVASYVVEGNFRFVAVLLACAVFFMSSWFIYSTGDGYATKEGSERIVLYQGKGAFFTVPYTGKIYYLQDFTASAKVFLLLDGEGEVKWEAKVKLSLTADYDQSFALLREFRGAVAWKSAVQRLFQQEVDCYVAEYISPDQAVIPKSFVFQLAEEGFTKLGFSPGEVTVREISRVIYKGGDKGG